MRLRPDYKEVISRYRKLYYGTKGAVIIVGIKEAHRNRKKIDYGMFELPNNYQGILDLMIENTMNYWQNRQGVNDDSLPQIRPRYGLMEHSAFITYDFEKPKVEIHQNTSYHYEILSNLEELSKLQMNEESPYLKMTIDGIKYLSEKMEGICLVAQRGVNSPLDLANSLRGNDLFLDCLLEEEKTLELLDFCLEADKKYALKQMEVTPSYEGGYVTGFGVWLPGYSFGHVADDASVIMGPDTYEKIGFNHSVAFAKMFDYVYFHCHTTGHYSIPAIAKNDKILVLEISNDPNEKRGIEVFKMYEENIKKFVVSLELSFEELKENLEFLQDKRVILNVEAKTNLEATQIVDYVRQVLPIV